MRIQVKFKILFCWVKVAGEVSCPEPTHAVDHCVEPGSPVPAQGALVQPCVHHVLFIQKDVQLTCHFCPQCGCRALQIQGGVVSLTVGGPDAGRTGCPYLAWSEEASCREDLGGRGDLRHKPGPPRWLGETGRPQVKTQKHEAAGGQRPVGNTWSGSI